jgi:hypothetical protein
MFCEAAGEALSPAEHPSGNLSALRASNWTSQFEQWRIQAPAHPIPLRTNTRVLQLFVQKLFPFAHF